MSNIYHAKRLLAHAVGIGLVALTLIWVGAPAHAAACEYGKGVTVVVQGEGLNSTTCVLGGAGKSAWTNLQNAGYSVTPVRGQAGTLCQINGKPAINECWKVDSYWGFFHANGKGGGWSYSQTGITSHSAGAGGWVGFKFQNSNARQSPDGTPVGPKPAPAPKPEPTKKPSTKPSAQSSSSKATPAATASPSATSKGKTTNDQGSKTVDKSAANDAESSTSEPEENTDDDTKVLSSVFSDDDGSGPSPWTFVAVSLIVGAAGLLGWRVWQRR